MDFTTTLEKGIRSTHQADWHLFLSVQKFLVEKHFEWVKLYINQSNKTLLGEGNLHIGSKSYKILLSYSPFHKYRYDRIYILDDSIKYNKSIHLYNDLSLCLYHPTIDQPLLQKIPLFRMIPWISEWIVFYEQWKIYGVWFGNEIKH